MRSMGDSAPPVQNSVDYTSAQYIPDGVLIHGGADLRGLKASWIVLIQLDAPVLPPGFIKQLNKVRRYYTPLVERFNISKPIVDAWEDRIERMTPLATNFKNVRHRRGLLDAGGHLLHILFGVATSEQVNKYTKLVTQLKDQNEAILHNIPELATMINQSRKYIKANEERITSIEAHEGVIRSYMRDMGKKLVAWEVRLNSAEVQIEMDRILSVLEMLYSEYSLQVNYFHGHRIALEEGRLTENLLPPRELRTILQLAVQRGYKYVEQVEWYY